MTSIVACGTGAGSDPSTGGTATGATGGAVATAGTPTGGSGTNGGAGANGGVAPSGGTTAGEGGTSGATAGQSSGGNTAGGGGGGANSGGAGTAGASGAGGGGSGYPLKNPPVPSAGCGKPTTITTSAAYRTIMSSGNQRQYMITMPPNYDMNKPYRYIYASHGQGGEGSDITREKYYGIQNIVAAADSVIFVSASGLGGIWGLKDVPLFDDILNFVEANACVDKSRVFVLGFSFGGMYSYSLSMTRQKIIRGAIGMSPANYNIQIPPKSHDPIAWMQSTGMSDGTCPWVSNEAQMRGSKFIAIEHGTDNGCTVPNPMPTWSSGGMLCNEFAGCSPGFPTKVCTFNGGHGLPPGSANWMWEFISQF